MLNDREAQVSNNAQESREHSSPILITGAAQRLGRHAAVYFVQQGYPVIISYRRERDDLDELRALGIQTIQADFSDTAGVLAFIQKVKAMTPCLRGIIHNASAWLPDNPDAEQAAEGFTHLFNIHMLAPYLINQECRGLLMTHDGLRDILHMTDAVVRKGSKKHGAYVATKAGLESLTQSFAALYAPDIKVNAIAPAMIMFNDDDDEAYRAKTLKKSALQIEPGAEVISQSLEYILNNSYLTGVTLPVEGGRSLL